MNVSEIIFIVAGTVLAVLCFTVLVYSLLDDPWLSRFNSNGVVIAILMSLALVAFGVMMYAYEIQATVH